jgi:hypothetical protein
MSAIFSIVPLALQCAILPSLAIQQEANSHAGVNLEVNSQAIMRREVAEVGVQQEMLQREMGEILQREGMGADNLLCKLKQDMHSKMLSAWSDGTASTAFLEDAKTSGGGDHVKGIEAVADGSKIDKFFNHRLRSCAVVSNSGVLSRHNHGSVIDTADMVLRFNDAPLQKWSRFVGTRDDIRIVNEQFPERLFKKKLPSYVFNQSTLFGLLPFKHPDGLEQLRSMYPSTEIKVLPGSLMESFQHTLQSIYDRSWFRHKGVSYLVTSGAIGMLSALAACDEVWAFGMAETPSSPSSPYHYFPREDNTTAPEHDAGDNVWHKTFKAERDLWRRIARNSASDIDATDMAVITGFPQIQC